MITSRSKCRPANRSFTTLTLLTFGPIHPNHQCTSLILVICTRAEFLGAFVCCPFSTEVSMPILCPLVQPNKAIGLESHIGSWLARCLEPTLLLAKLHEPTASNHHRKHETDEI